MKLIKIILSLILFAIFLAFMYLMTKPKDYMEYYEPWEKNFVCVDEFILTEEDVE